MTPNGLMSAGVALRPPLNPGMAGRGGVVASTSSRQPHRHQGVPAPRCYLRPSAHSSCIYFPDRLRFPAVSDGRNHVSQTQPEIPVRRHLLHVHRASAPQLLVQSP